MVISRELFYRFRLQWYIADEADVYDFLMKSAAVLKNVIYRYLIPAVPLTDIRHTGLDPVSSKRLKNLDSGSAKMLTGMTGLFLILMSPGFYASICNNRTLTGQ